MPLFKKIFKFFIITFHAFVLIFICCFNCWKLSRPCEYFREIVSPGSALRIHFFSIKQKIKFKYFLIKNFLFLFKYLILVLFEYLILFLSEYFILFLFGHLILFLFEHSILFLFEYFIFIWIFYFIFIWIFNFIFIWIFNFIFISIKICNLFYLIFF